MSILNIEKVTKVLGDRTIFDEVSLGINEGDKIGVVGVNGTGKSTLLKIVAGIMTPDEGKIIKSNNLVISYLEQTPVFLEGESIVDYVCRGGTKDTFEHEAKTILTKLNITDFDADITKLSGGQKKRIALAKALVMPCELLILDEPTNHLDHEMIIWLEGYIKNYKGQLLMVTHDRYFLDNVTNRIVEVDKGKLYSYQENYSGFLKLKCEREEMALSTEAKRQNILRKEMAWIMRGCKARSTKQQARIDRYEDMKEASRLARQNFEKQNLELSSIATRLGKKTVELSNITKCYGQKKLIDDFTYIFLRDDRIGFIGENGCGKSTMMKIISGLEKPDNGNVEVGPTVAIGYFMQESEFKDETLTVLEYVKGIGEYVVTTDGRITASAMCEKFLFSSKMQYTPISKLSGGEKRRLYLLSVLMTSPNVLILDEPTNDLDIETLEILEEYLDSFVGIIIMVSHDRYFLDRMADRIFAFEGNGKISQYEGGFSDYYEKASQKQGNAGGSKSTDTVQKTVKYEKSHEKKLKFTYAEQKEFETIDEKIEKLEEKISALDEKISACATDFVKLNEYMNEKSECENMLESMMERWVYLNDLNEKIQAQ